ncbi:hypothetical protein PUW24_06115 [Paenibacillus urinalis]|uniref:Uncharacterized protein n=1 Tax=Paenibacillus urinalis TaxID=521520 RepID=A0AAX3MZ89_9BACL|nr:hypothetical protein [Paenibacillus urinalis]WDH82441.1 hypothetical protein PUW23_23845 [Paenibacillus urinalis]WDH98498.1 hypothetical protein PUW24_06115 [Paenibacillus urinalis]WDI02189.1 hypothetical protein PUW25_23840 [Paenibacillus urinalis]
MMVQQLRAIAEEVRTLLEAKYGSEYSDLQGKCVEASELISKKLTKQGIGHRIVEGWIIYDDASSCSNRDYDEHTWVEVGGLYIDVTLTQFEPFLEGPLQRVIVGEKPSFLVYEEPAESCEEVV